MSEKPTSEDLERDLRADLQLCEKLNSPSVTGETWLNFHPEAREGWPAAIRRALAAEAENKLLRSVVEAARDLWHSGYDGDLLGPICVPLSTAITDLDCAEAGMQPERSRLDVMARELTVLAAENEKLRAAILHIQRGLCEWHIEGGEERCPNPGTNTFTADEPAGARFRLCDHHMRVEGLEGQWKPFGDEP